MFSVKNKRCIHINHVPVYSVCIDWDEVKAGLGKKSKHLEQKS